MKQELFDIDFTSSAVFTISYVCLLLLGWKGCPTRSMKQNLIGMLFTLLDVSHYVLMLLPYRRLGLISCLIFSFCRATLKIDFDCHKRAQKKGIANWMPQWFMKLIQNGTPKRMHFTFVKALRTYGFGTLQSKLQLQKCLLMNMRYIHLHNGGRIISKQMNCLLRKHLPPYIVSLWIWRYFDRLRKHLRHHSVIHVFQQVSEAFFGLGFCTSCHSCLILLMPLMSLGRCGMVPLQNMFLS